MNECENNESFLFVQLLENVFGNYRADNYEYIIKKFGRDYTLLGCNMNIKMHFLDNYLD